MPITLEAATPPTADRAVVFACDNRYARYAFFAADQIARLHPSRDFDICLCASGEDLRPVESLAALGLRHCRIETGGIFAGLNLDARRTEAAYLRLALPRAFEGQYRRLVYFDSDIFVQGGDLARLLGLDLGGRAVAAVRDNIQWRTPGRRPEQFRLLGLPTAPYFNSGLLMIDVGAFNAAGLLDRCIDFARRHAGRMIGHDQNLLNCVLRGDWAELAPVWNWQYTRSSMLFEAMEGAHVIHFIGARKPWSHTGGGLPLRFRAAYRAFFAEHFPETPQVGPEGLAPHQNRGSLRKMLLRHLLAVNRFSDYLDRFDSDLDVIVRS